MLRMDGIFYTPEVRVKGKAVRKNTPLNRAFPDKLLSRFNHFLGDLQ